MTKRRAELSLELLNETWSHLGNSVLCMTILYSMFANDKSAMIKPQAKLAVNLFIADDLINSYSASHDN